MALVPVEGLKRLQLAYVGGWFKSHWCARGRGMKALLCNAETWDPPWPLVWIWALFDGT